MRRLFWVRLQLTQLPSALPSTSTSTLLFSTAHFTWQGHAREYDTDLNLRKVQSRHTVLALDRLQAVSDRACFFGGDLNESFWPKRVLEGAGFVDCFSALGLPCRATHPMRPTLAHEDVNADSALDWLFARGGICTTIPVPVSSAGHLSSSSGTDTDDTSCQGSAQVRREGERREEEGKGPGVLPRKPSHKPPPRALAALVVRDSVGLSSEDPQESRVLAVQPSDHAPVLAVYRVPM